MASHKDLALIFRARGQTAVVRSSDAPSFRDFVHKITDSIPSLKDMVPTYTFDINPDQKCSLTGEGEFVNMILLCTLLHKTVVHIYGPDIDLNVTPYANTDQAMNQPCQNQHLSPQPQLQPSSEPNVTDTNQPHHSGAKEGEGPSRKFKRQLAKENDMTGNWFAGAQTAVPSYGICPEEEHVILRSANWVEYINGVGQEFPGGVTEFRHKLVKYSTKVGFQFKYTKNDARYVRAICAKETTDQCKWFIKGSVCSISNAFVIKEADLTHTCALLMMSSDTKRMGQRLIGGFITDAVRATPTLTAIDIQRDIQKYWGFEVTYEKVWRSLEVARANIFGCFDDSFDELRWYSAAITRTNPGSVVKLESESGTNRFKRFFVSFDASLKGFRHCRPMLFVDGTFMKTRYKGTLLSATAKDGNNGLFPVAMAIVESENSDNWTWFINMITEHVTHDLEIIYVSDRAGGLLNAFKSVPTKPLHFYCLFHLMKNLRSMYNAKKYSEVFKNLMCKLLKDAAYAPTVHLFQCAISIFTDKGGTKAVAFLKDLPLDKWAVAYSPDVHRYGELTSNAAESFNSWILEPRSLPICFMLDCIRMQLMRWFNERRSAIAKCTGALTPRMEELWNSLQVKGQHWSIIPSNKSGVMEVLATTTVVVDINNRKCGCYQWQLLGFPCAHAVAVITRGRINIRTVVSPYFFTDTYAETYRANINPVPQSERAEFIDLNQPNKILPPLHKVVAGRPKQKRYRSKGESKAKRFRCSRCGQVGSHYWSTCGAALH